MLEAVENGARREAGERFFELISAVVMEVAFDAETEWEAAYISRLYMATTAKRLEAFRWTISAATLRGRFAAG